MNSSELLELSKKVDKYIQHMRDHVVKEEQAITELEKEKASVHDELTRQINDITRIATDNDAIKAATLELRRRYQQRDHDIQKAIEEHQRSLHDIQHELDDAERVNGEVKKHENLFRDIEIRAQTWINKAKSLSIG